MIQRFELYLQEGAVERNRPDQEKANALFAKAKKRLRYVENRPVDDALAEFFFEDAYDVMRESASALMALRGLKPFSHEAIVAYLRDREGMDMATVNTFDNCRKLRNRSLYEAVHISSERAIEAIAFAKIVLRQLEPRLHS